VQELTASVESVVASAASFEEFEDGVFAAACDIARAIAQEALSAHDDRLAAHLGQGWRVKDVRTKTVMTRFGPLEISRRRCIDPDGATRYPLDEHYALPARCRISPSLERAMVSLSANVSFRDAADVLARLLSAHVSHTAAHALLRRAGKRLEAQADAAARDLTELGLDPGGKCPAPRLYCEADGHVISLQHARARRGEVKLAAFYTDKRDGIGAVHAGFGPASAFWPRAAAAAGAHYDLSSVREAVVAGDGARWVRGGLDVLLSSRFQLDPFHIKRAIGRAMGKEASPGAVFDTLYERGPEAADTMLARFAREHPERSDEIDEVRRYLASNADGLWREGPGCGTIEGHIDKIIANRMSKRGRRWSPEGADAMAHVLAASRTRRPLPCGWWQTPKRPGADEPVRPATAHRCRAAAPGKVTSARIVSHMTGESFTRKLRDIAGTRKADY